MQMLIATLHTFGLRIADQARTRLSSAPERGSETIEKVLWAVAVIAIVAIVVVGITNYVTTKTGQIV